jgi:hypothetical protein
MLLGDNRCRWADRCGLRTSWALLADRSYGVRNFKQWPGPLHETDKKYTERAESGRHAKIAFTSKRADFIRLAAAHQLKSSPFRAIVALSFAAFGRLYERSDIVLGSNLRGLCCLPERLAGLDTFSEPLRWPKAALGRPSNINSMFDVAQSRPEQVLVLEGNPRAARLSTETFSRSHKPVPG